MFRITIRLLLAAFFLSAMDAAAFAQKRLALVVGVERYDNLPEDRRPRKALRDAQAVGATLARLGFEVETAANINRAEFIRVWTEFVSRIEFGDVAVFYFAGHGVELSGANYLTLTDTSAAAGAGFDAARLLRESAVSLDVMFNDAHRRIPQTGLFIVDACRVNPFTDGQGEAVGGRRGLGWSDLPKAIFALYAASVREEALDSLGEGDGDPNSVFVRALLPILDEPVFSLVQSFPVVHLASAASRRTRELAAKAGKQQVPVYFDETLNGVFLEEKAATPVSAFASAPTASFTPIPSYASPAPAPAPGGGFRDCPRCPEMVAVPAGSFVMGRAPDAPGKGASASAAPQHQVTFARPFAVGRFAVTFAEWDACVRDGGCGAYLPSRAGWARSDRPVINISRDDAHAYTRWLSARTGKAYRLLSEAEREYVTRAGSRTPFWWGDSVSTRWANYDGRVRSYLSAKGRKKTRYRRRTVPVKSFRRNPWGLYQVHGNVWEWVEDCWHETYDGAPTDGSAWMTGNCIRHVLRGGGWSSEPDKLRSDNRGWAYSSRTFDFSFRVARPLE
jgi:formylglycine-generating enzyme required for sulfatase activity